MKLQELRKFFPQIGNYRVIDIFTSGQYSDFSEDHEWIFLRDAGVYINGEAVTQKVRRYPYKKITTASLCRIMRVLKLRPS